MRMRMRMQMLPYRCRRHSHQHCNFLIGRQKTKDKRQSGWTSLRRHAHCIQPTGSRQRQTQRQTSRRRCRRSFSRRRSKGDQEFVRTKWGGGSRPQTAGASITRDADGGQTTTTRGYVHAPYNKTKNRRYQKHASRTAGGSLLELNIKWNGPHGGHVLRTWALAPC